MSSPEYTPKQIADDRYNNDSQELELVWFAVRLKLEKFYGVKSSADTPEAENKDGQEDL
jgi:hypothetical protein